MKLSFNIIKILGLLLIEGLSAIICDAAKTQNAKKTNTFENPDFAYPKTVVDNANLAIESAMHEINTKSDADMQEYVKVIKGFMQRYVAGRRISEDTAIVEMPRVADSIIDLFEQKGDKGLLAADIVRLLEANIYVNYYNQNKWRFNGRGTLIDVDKENPASWGRGNFAKKMVSLIDTIFNREFPYSDIPLSKLSALLEKSELIRKMSVYDFIVLQSYSILRNFTTDYTVIPFGDKSKKNNNDSLTADELSSRILDNAIEYEKQHGFNATIVRLIQLKTMLVPEYDNQRKKFLYYWKDKLFDTPYCADVIVSLYNLINESYGNEVNEEETGSLGNQEVKDIYDAACQYIKRFPDCYGIQDLVSIVNSVRQKSVSVTCSNLITTRQNPELKCLSNNIHEFYLLIYKVEAKEDQDYIDSSILYTLKPVKVKKLSYSGTVPFSNYETVLFDKLPAGDYVAVASTLPVASKKSMLQESKNVAVFRVCDIDIMVCNGNEKSYIYVVDASTQQPLRGASVELFSTEWNKRNKLLGKHITNEEGYVEVSGFKSAKIKAGYNGSKVSDYIYINKFYSDDRLEGNIFTDLPIYHPGDSLSFTAVTWRIKDKSIEPLTEMSLEMSLHDTNGNVVESIPVSLNEYGRIAGMFKLAENGLLGTWQLNLKTKDGKYISQKTFEVAEYKSPTFYVDMEQIADDYRLGDIIKLRGKASTYSGMPLSGAKVSVEVRYQPVYRFFRIYDAKYGLETVCDQNGEFIIELPTEGLKGTPFSSGLYIASASVTSLQGETQSSSHLIFALGKDYSIVTDIPEIAEIDGPELKCDIKVLDIMGNPVKTRLKYVITDINDKEFIRRGVIDVPASTINIDSLRPGKYDVKFTLSETGVPVVSQNATVVLYDANAEVSPYETSLWMPASLCVVPAGDKEVTIKAGSSYSDDYLFVVVSDENNILERYWLKPSEKLHNLIIKTPDSDNRIYVTVSSLHNYHKESKTVMLIPRSQLDNLKIEVNSFRDKLTPGAKEKWQFKFISEDGETGVAQAMAVMSNKALNSIVPFKWLFNPYSSITWHNQASQSYLTPYNISWYYYENIKNNSKINSSNWPMWLYKLASFYANVEYTSLSMNRSYSMAANDATMPDRAVMMKKEAQTESIEEECSDFYAGGAAITEEGNIREESINIRDVECPLAFFIPMLQTDKDGVLSIEFNVPNFNTTWQLQLAGYNNKMHGSVLTLDAIASKPVMISVNVPRFMRTGDKAVIEASVYNNTEENADITSTLSVINPATGKEIASKKELLDMTAGEGKTVLVEFDVPSDCNSIYIKGVAISGDYSDGEGGCVVVIPASEPIIESTPIYIGRGASELSFKLPDYKSGNVTIKYCNNPVWSCVTALPQLITDESDNIFAAVVNLYGNAVATGLVKKYPQIGEALKFFVDSQQSSVTSPLQLNESLKAVELNNTPWVNDAQSETDRMRQLVDLTDAAKCEAAIAGCADKIISRQNSDGSWSWFESMPPSLFITMGNILILGELNNLGYLPPSLDESLQRAVKYCDGEWVRMSTEKYFNPLSMCEYLFARRFVKTEMTPNFVKLRTKAIKTIKDNWREMSISNKAQAAVILNENGDSQDARHILESLRQYASESEEKGMWWDNLESGSSNMYSLLTTSNVLECWYAIAPDAPEIDKIRQWLLINKQSQNWSSNRFLSEIVSAILTTGSNWIADNQPAEIFVGKKRLEIPDVQKLTGEVVSRLPDKSAGKTLKIIKHTQAPAWGGIINQYIEDIDKVKQHAIPQMSVMKQIQKISETDEGTVLSTPEYYRVGDKVRVQLSVICDRDLEYICITDSRSACFEPVDQVSSYNLIDGVWVYKEVRDKSTNLFISNIRKGMHVITYDCYIDRPGEYSIGIAQMQSLYAPELSAHSSGDMIVVKQ